MYALAIHFVLHGPCNTLPYIDLEWGGSNIPDSGQLARGVLVQLSAKSGLSVSSVKGF